MKFFPTSKALPAFGMLVLLAFLCPQDADAGYRQKISVELFTNPAGWEEPYNPGVIMSDYLQDYLSSMGMLHIVAIPGAKRTAGKMAAEKMEPPSEMKSETMSPEIQMEGEEPQKSMAIKKDMKKLLSPVSRITNMPHPAQLVIKGKVLSLMTSSKMPLSVKAGTNPVPVETVEMVVEIKIVKHHTGRLLARQIIKVHSEDGKGPFVPSENVPDEQNPSFKNSSLADAIQKLSEDAATFITQTIGGLHLEGEIVVIDEKNEEVTINLGRENGIQLRDEFDMYSVDLKFADPLSQTDLGDKLTRLGVVKVNEVYDKYSRAKVIAGYGISQGDLVRSKRNPLFVTGK